MQMLLFRIPREISVEHTQQTFPVVQRDCRGRGPKAIKNNMINGFPLSLSADVLRSFAFNCRYTLPGFLFFFDFALFLFLCQGFPLQHHTTNKIFFFFFSHSSFPNSLGGTFLADYKYHTLLGLRSRPLSFSLSSAAIFFYTRFCCYCYKK